MRLKNYNLKTGEIEIREMTAEEAAQMPDAQQIAANLAALSEAETKAALSAIDLASIRSIREYIAAKPDAPQILKDLEAAAVAARAKLGGV